MTESRLGAILAIQIAVARLGEKPLRFWWNSDIADIDGGTDLLSRLVGSEMAPFSAIEGVLLVARQAEERLLAAIPAPPAYSLFCPEPDLRTALRRRFRHFKTYPEELPDPLKPLIHDELREDELIAAIGTGGEADTTSGAGGPAAHNQTSFGIELLFDASAHDPVRRAALLASIATQSPRRSYTLPYYRGDANV